MRFCVLLLALLAGILNASAEEISGEVDLSMIDPYTKIVPGFNLSFHPEMLSWNRLSFGAGIGIHVSSRFKYETSPHWIEFTPDEEYQTDSTAWFYFDENLVELVNYEFFTETRFQLVGLEEDSKWKSWLTVHLGFMDHTSRRTQYTDVAEQWEYVDSTGAMAYETVAYAQDTYDYAVVHKSSFYLSPGIMIGVGNFIVGYRHWIYLNDRTLVEGEPAQTLGTIRVGYRFVW